MKITSCYRNLTKNCISAKTGTNPIAHYDTVKINSVRFHVNENGRQKVLKRQRKGVHAYVKGYEPKAVGTEENLDQLVHISYNPYKAGYFYRKDNGEAVNTADYAIITTRGVFASNPQ